MVFLVLGFLCVGLAGLGVALPGLPTTPFLLLAAACFARSSPKLHGWLVNNRFFAPLIKNWQESRSIPQRTKRIALFVIVLVGTTSVIMIQSIYLKMFVFLILIFPVVFLIRLKETERIALPERDE
jgi:uncharacterized membrane protein YbaN (DUF454 family)